MNAIKTLCFIVVFLSSAVLFAQEQNNTRHNKSTKEERLVGLTNKIEIQNQYGNITYKGWDKDSIIIDVNIWVETPDADIAQSILDKIEILPHLTAGTLMYKTIFKDNFFSNYPFGIEFTIFAPSNMELELHNRFGNMNLTHFGAKLNIDLQYGNFNLRNQTAMIPGGRISVTNGDLSLEKLSNAEIVHKNGHLKMDEVYYTSLMTDFSTGEIKTAENLKVNLSTSNLKITDVKNLTAAIMASTLTVDRLSYKAYFETTDMSLLSIQRTMPSTEQLTVTATNSQTKIGLSSNLSYTLHGEMINGQITHYQPENITKIRDGNTTSFSGDFEQQNMKPASIILFGENGDITVYLSDKKQ
jgi:hypothetical protein